MYYFGRGEEFRKEDCKEYKTLDGARKAFDKALAAGEAATVWDENGVVIIGLTDDVPEGALQENPDGSINVYDEEGNKVGTMDAAAAAERAGEGLRGSAETPTDAADNDGQDNHVSEQEKGQDEAETKPEQGAEDGQQGSGKQTDEPETDTVIVPQGTMKVTVICDGALNLRRSPRWGNRNVCGRASRGQSYYVKEIHTVDGKKMVRTIDDLYLSGASEHVQFEQL